MEKVRVGIPSHSLGGKEIKRPNSISSMTITRRTKGTSGKAKMISTRCGRYAPAMIRCRYTSFYF
jgi:hypothetical protein